MKQTIDSDIYYERWRNLPWKIFFSRKVYLQAQIHNSRKVNDFDKLYRDQAILMTSKACHYIAIEEANLIYARFYGLSMTYERRFNFIALLEQQNALSIFCNKVPNKKPIEKFLFSIENSIKEFLWKLAIEPAYKATLPRYSLFRYERILKNYRFKKTVNAFTNGSIQIILINWKKLMLTSKYNYLLAKLDLSSNNKILIYKALKNGLLGLLNEIYLVQTLKHPLASFLLSIILEDLDNAFNPLEKFFSKTYIVYFIRNSDHLIQIKEKFKRIFLLKSPKDLSDIIVFF